MNLAVVLDTSPLSLLASPVKSDLARSANDWAASLLNAGHRLIVPSIADYEVRRELERLRLTESLARLDAFAAAAPGRYIALSDEMLHLAARLWADARNRGNPTADYRELDCDVLIAAQALSLDVEWGDVIVATTNVGHLSQFITASLWTAIEP